MISGANGIDLDVTRRASLVDPAALRARVTGRSWWALLYRDGAIVPEWSCDWTQAPTRGRQALRLYAPNGQIAELGTPGLGENDGRFFQLKVAIAAAGEGSETLAHVVGMVVKPDGTVRCAAWDYRTRRLLTFLDNAHHMRYEGIGPLATDPLGLSPA